VRTSPVPTEGAEKGDCGEDLRSFIRPEDLVKVFDLAAGLGVAGPGVLGGDAEDRQFGLDGAAPVAGWAVKMARLSVSIEARNPPGGGRLMAG
jgi:hypothetical protein